MEPISSKSHVEPLKYNKSRSRTLYYYMLKHAFRCLALSFLMALSGLPEVSQEPQEVEYIYPDEEDEDEGE